MNVDDAISVFFDHLLRDHNQESGKNDQIRLAGIQLFKECFIKSIPCLIIFRGNTQCLDAMISGTLQGICIFIITDNDFYFCIGDRSAVNRI